MKIKPLADRVLVQPTAAEEVTASGIIIPDSAKEKPLRGTVLAVGNGTKDEQMVLKEGDKVLYGKYAGTEVKLDGEKVLIMRQNEVFAVIED
ncbi:MAG: co-chaperone GroES [Bacteroidales bacterium]|nr:co-chaperone GroES [Bacteroidales bacterium]MCD8387339.1 co-chaperone GroES [Bacteroidales bacterium]